LNRLRRRPVVRRCIVVVENIINEFLFDRLREDDSVARFEGCVNATTERSPMHDDRIRVQQDDVH
jgi:hypothetical protein